MLWQVIQCKQKKQRWLIQDIPLTNLENGCQLFINIKKYKMLKIRKYYLAIKYLCFKKPFLTYSLFLPQASLNNWNKNWHKFYYRTLFYLSSLPGLWQSLTKCLKYKMLKIRKYYLAIQYLCFKKPFLTYSLFLPQASLNNWNKNWHKFYYRTLFYLSSLPGLWQSLGGAWG